MDHQEINDRLRELHEKWKNKTISPEELFEFQEWLKVNEESPVSSVPPEFALSEHQLRDRILNSIRERDQQSIRIKQRRLRVRMVAAAILVVLGCTGIYRWLSTPSDPGNGTAQLAGAEFDVEPGGFGAVLTLGDGTEIMLDSVKAGIVAIQSGKQIVLNNGQLAYTPARGEYGEVTFNTIRAPRGRQFHLQLPDGSLVWLGSLSSIRYPTSFTGNKREVSITGEVYFEIAPDPTMPFWVDVNQRSKVEVLGTHFNVKAYDNEEEIKTTLIEGKVRVSGMSNRNNIPNRVVLLPGQQAVQRQKPGNESLTVLKDVDIEQVIAWKNGYFNFENVDLKEMMRQIERWYDVNIVYEGKAPDINFFGEVSRKLKLSDIIRYLEKMGVNIKLEKDKTIVIQGS